MSKTAWICVTLMVVGFFCSAAMSDLRKAEHCFMFCGAP